MTKENKLEVGDKVIINSDAVSEVPMTVKHIRENTNIVTCMWFTTDKEYREEIFYVDTLTKLNSFCEIPKN